MIGIFDSGVGGMTVAHAVEQALPDLDIVYFGDLARTPYGSKSETTIGRYAEENIEFLIDKGATLIIIACNSAASVAAAGMRSRFDLPILDVITPAVRKAADIAAGGRGRYPIGVIGTRATVRSGVYEREIRARYPGARVISRACPLLVPLVEEGWINRPETKMILRRYLHPLRTRQVRALVLGCTHYPLLGKLIRPRIGKRVTIIDSSVEVAAHLRSMIAADPALAARLTRTGSKRYFVSDVTEAARQTAARIFGRPIELTTTRL